MLTELNKTDPTEQKILAFKDKVESKSNQKSGEMLEIDSAVWYIEAALNYTYCDPGISNIINVDSVFVTVPVSESGEINFSNVVSAYNDFSSNLNNLVNQKADDDKKIQLADISIVENDDINVKTLKLTTIITNFHHKMPEGFYPNDYWHPIWGAGRCGDYEGEGIGCDAGIVIAQHAAQFINWPLFGYITDVSEIIFWGYENTEYLWGDVLYDYKDACLSPNELKYWTSKLVQLGNNNIPYRKRVIGYRLEGDVSLNQDPPYHFCHDAYISYGIWHSHDEEEF